MDVVIKQLTQELAADYFDFFDNRAFTDNSPYRCYCQMYQMSKEQYKKECENSEDVDFGILSKNIAKQQIESSMLCGYLAYADGISVGWCNANDRANYPSEPFCDVLFHSPTPQREIAVVCFEIAPDYRGRGIATALLNRVTLDARVNGYSSVMSFPVKRSERCEWDCNGPIRLYDKAGFVKVAEQDKFVIMRKELK